MKPADEIAIAADPATNGANRHEIHHAKPRSRARRKLRRNSHHGASAIRRPVTGNAVNANASRKGSVRRASRSHRRSSARLTGQCPPLRRGSRLDRTTPSMRKEAAGGAAGAVVATAENTASNARNVLNGRRTSERPWERPAALRCHRLM